MSFRAQLRYMNAYDVHKTLINDYILKRPGDTTLLKRDTSKDRTDLDVIRENHKFLWDEDDLPESWEAEFAKKYYDKLFKEFCISDLSRYKENKVALRWRIEQEVIAGKGQFSCGNKTCTNKDDLKTWEVNFAYIEDKQKKNALIKLRLCPDCSKKLNYHSKKREIKRIKGKVKKHKKHQEAELEEEPGSSTTVNVESEEENSNNEEEEETKNEEESPWENIKPIENKSRDEEMEDYLQELLL